MRAGFGWESLRCRNSWNTCG